MATLGHMQGRQGGIGLGSGLPSLEPPMMIAEKCEAVFLSLSFGHGLPVNLISSMVHTTVRQVNVLVLLCMQLLPFV